MSDSIPADVISRKEVISLAFDGSEGLCAWLDPVDSGALSAGVSVPGSENKLTLRIEGRLWKKRCKMTPWIANS